ncbi:UNVERIFIED_CONTAM: hypothetical protein RMT77_005880 [Armadillidium vulgare]
MRDRDRYRGSDKEKEIKRKRHNDRNDDGINILNYKNNRRTTSKVKCNMFDKKSTAEENEEEYFMKSETFTNEEEYFMKSETFVNEEEPVTTLIDIQGDNSDIEMNDLAKGTEVEKVYESHPLGMEIEGIKPKRKRGRPRKDSNEKRKKTCNFTASDLTETQVRPKRNRYLPSRFRDSLAGKEFDKLLSTDGTINRVNACDIQTGNDVKEFLEENSNLSESATTHTLEGNTVVVTSNHRDELYDKLPEAVNIELDFSNGKDSNYKYRRKGKVKKY